MHYLHNKNKAKKKIVLFPEIGRMKNFLSLSRPHSWLCIITYIFNFKKHQINKQKETRIQKSKRNLKRKEKISEKSVKINKFGAAQVKIFPAIRISGNKSNFFWPNAEILDRLHNPIHKKINTTYIYLINNLHLAFSRRLTGQS